MSPPASPTDRDESPQPPSDGLTYEQAIEEIEAIVERIEQGEAGLEESLAAYQRGAALLKRCRDILDTAEQQIEELRLQEDEDKIEGGAGE